MKYAAALLLALSLGCSPAPQIVELYDGGRLVGRQRLEGGAVVWGEYDNDRDGVFEDEWIEGPDLILHQVR